MWIPSTYKRFLEADADTDMRVKEDEAIVIKNDDTVTVDTTLYCIKIKKNTKTNSSSKSRKIRIDNH